MTQQAETVSPATVRFRNSLACVPCRSRHVKCDANKPGCTRCRIDGKTCYFMKSRRGLRNKIPASDNAPEILPRLDASYSDGYPTLKESHGFPVTTSSGVGTPSPLVKATLESRLPISLPKILNPAESELDKHLKLYYTYFHNAHPWVLPRPRLNRLMQSSRSQIETLLTVMNFIGSTYTSEGQSMYLRQRAIDTMTLSTIPKTAFTVQALLLLAVGTHCCSDFQHARETITKAISIALEIGMQSKLFSVANGNGDPVLEESWRRTWWGLFVMDATLEAIGRTYNFSLWHIHADVDLPCEESEYHREEIPQPRTVAEYKERDLAEIEVSYSSFAYLIDTVTIMGSVMAAALKADEISDSIIDDADGSLVNWKFHLPDEKKDILKTNGEIDEVLFQAHMNFNVIQVHLHRLRSRLVHSPVEDTAKCAPPPPPLEIPRSQRQTSWLSTKKTLDAAEQAINIFTLPTNLINHTPMIICGVVLSILAEISACSYVLQGAQYESARNRIRLGIGTLKEYGKVWPVGHQSLIEVKGIAREVFAMAALRKEMADIQDLDVNGYNSVDSLDIQSYFDEFGALDYLSMLDVSSVI